MSYQSKPYRFHLVDEPSELCLQARAQFMESIMQLKPQVVADLWHTAFPEFKRAVIRHFSKEILGGIENIDAYFDEQQKRYLEDFDSHYFHLLHRKLEESTGARPYAAFELLSERPELKEKINEVVRQFIAAVHTAVVVKLIQSKLTTEFGVDPIRSEFRFYSCVEERGEDQALVIAIQKWSERWNLNADWCRDYAIAVLCEWLSHPELGSVGFYTTEQAMQSTGWASATNELLFASIASRISTETAVYGMQEPKPLKFKWGDFEFERRGFNRLRETQTEYTQKSLIEFELWLGDKRRPLLLELLHSDEQRADPKLEPNHQVLNRFKKTVKGHIFETVKATDKSVGLAKTKRKRALANHVRWAVEFHVAPPKTLQQITDFEDHAIQVAEVLRDASPNGLTREEIGRKFSDYNHITGDDVDRALALLLERGVIYTEQEDPTSRVIKLMRVGTRGERLAPDKSVYDKGTSWVEVKKQIEADYEQTGGAVIVRYVYTADKTIQEVPDRSVVWRASNDVLKLAGLEISGGMNRTPPRKSSRHFRPVQSE